MLLKPLLPRTTTWCISRKLFAWNVQRSLLARSCSTAQIVQPATADWSSPPYLQQLSFLYDFSFPALETFLFFNPECYLYFLPLSSLLVLCFPPALVPAFSALSIPASVAKGFSHLSPSSHLFAIFSCCCQVFVPLCPCQTLCYALTFSSLEVSL